MKMSVLKKCPTISNWVGTQYPATINNYSQGQHPLRAESKAHCPSSLFVIPPFKLTDTGKVLKSRASWYKCYRRSHSWDTDQITSEMRHNNTHRYTCTQIAVLQCRAVNYKKILSIQSVFIVPWVGTPILGHGSEVPRDDPRFFKFAIRLGPYFIPLHNLIDPLFLQKKSVCLYLI